MTEELKIQIRDAASDYIITKALSNNEFSRIAGINISYLSSILDGKWDEHPAGQGKTIEISEKWFIRIAEAIGFEMEKTYWETVPTPEFQTIIHTLENAKKTGRPKMIIGESGCGKTYAVERFTRANPQHTYVITVNSIYNLADVISEISEKLRLVNVGTKATKLKDISSKLHEVKQNGYKPILILDEAENLKMPALAMLKGLYDAVKDSCSIILIGTDQLVLKLDKLRLRNKEGMPQLYRRFKAGIKVLPEIDRSFKSFVGGKIEDRGLMRLLIQLCDNYGELNDYLEPALREADKAGKLLTEEYFRLMYNMPK